MYKLCKWLYQTAEKKATLKMLNEFRNRLDHIWQSRDDLFYTSDPLTDSQRLDNIRNAIEEAKVWIIETSDRVEKGHRW